MKAAMQEQETAEFDVVIVGAGVAGLAAAIRLKQLNPALSVIVLEKAAQIGGQILSGALIDPVGLQALLPDWDITHKEADSPFTNPVLADNMLFLTRKRSFRLPHRLMPKLISDKGAYIASLGRVCCWLAAKAEALGAEIFPGFAAAKPVFAADGALIGVETGDMGRAADGTKGVNFTPGMRLLGKYILIAEGARGSLAQQLISRFDLSAHAAPQKYGLGLKELWEILPKQHQQGRAEHYFGWPLGRKATGGGFVYHMEDNRLALGLIVHLDYQNPYLSPFDEFQQWKTHPALAKILAGGKRVSYGARVINEGGIQSVPRLSFNGGALIGCAAGFVNLPRLKGSHNAVLSGIAAAEAAAKAIKAGRAHDALSELDAVWRQGAIGRDLYPVRNMKPFLERFGTVPGAALGGADIWCSRLFGFSPFGTLRHGKTDAAALKPAAQCRKITYPKPDGVLSFDRPSSLFLANISARDGALCHLQILDKALQQSSEWGIYGGPSARYCPAGVYEWLPQKAAKQKGGQTEKGSEQGKSAAGSGKQQKNAMQYCIFAQNCIHCKTCDIKDPNGNIRWTVPEGGEGPIYSDM